MIQRSFLSLIVGYGLMVMAGCAGSQPSPGSPPAVAVVSPPVAPTAPVTPAVAPVAAVAPAPGAAGANAPSPDLVRQARGAGYRPENRNGSTVFCKTEVTTGSHFANKTCINEAQLQATLIQQQQQNDMQQNRACGSASCLSH